MERKNLIVGQSGGPTAAINSSLAGVYVGAKELGIDTVYGMRYGIEGLLKENIINLDDTLESTLNVELLKRKFMRKFLKYLINTISVFSYISAATTQWIL